VKLPIPFLTLGVIGIVLCWKQRQPAFWAPVTYAAGLMVFALSSPVNIGIRHVMPLLVFLAIPAAVALKHLWVSPRVWSQRAAAGLAVWMVATSAFSHPDYLAYFNFLAGAEPEKIIVDSDLDWGQDMKRLAARLQQVQAPYVYFNPFLIAHHEHVHGFPQILPTDPVQPQAGWTAVSITALKVTRLGLMYDRPDIDPWPNRIKPTERVGKGIYLYYFMPQKQQGQR
jgi:hypothetical protein